MNSRSKKSAVARAMPQPFKQRIEPAPQFKPVAAQLKTAASAPSVKRPVAPPVYPPQAESLAAQAKTSGVGQMKTHSVASAHKPPIAQSWKAVAGSSASQPITSRLVHRPHEKLLTAQRKAAVSARIVQQPLAPPAYKPTPQKVFQADKVIAQPQNLPLAQTIKQAVAPAGFSPQARPQSVQAKAAGSSQLRNQLIAARADRPQPFPRVLQTKKSYGQQEIQKQNGQKPYPAKSDHPHARASTSQATPAIRIQRIPVAQRRGAPVNSKSWQQGTVAGGRATSSVLQRSAPGPVTRSDIKEKQQVVALSKELKELWKGAAKEFGYDWEEASDKEKNEIMLAVEALQSAARTKKPPNKGGGNPTLVDFSYKGETKKGLDPGGAYYFKLVIHYSGTRTQDFLNADAALYKSGTIRPANTVWHHYHDYNPVHNTGTMFLMSITDHSQPHFGGMWMYNKK